MPALIALSPRARRGEDVDRFARVKADYAKQVKRGKKRNLPRDRLKFELAAISDEYSTFRNGTSNDLTRESGRRYCEIRRSRRCRCTRCQRGCAGRKMTRDRPERRRERERASEEEPRGAAGENRTERKTERGREWTTPSRAYHPITLQFKHMQIRRISFICCAN